MVTVGVVLYTFLTYILISLVVAIFFIPGLILLCIPTKYWHDSKIAYWGVHAFYVALQKASLLSITYKGIEHIPDEPVIFAANHQSSIDIPLLGVLANKKTHLWLAKIELMNSWLLKYILPRVAVLVDVKRPKRSMLSLLKVVSLVHNRDRHVMIFPEGGRFTSGGVHDFYGGFVILVKKLQRPIVPVYIYGANKVYPPDSMWVWRKPITVTVGKPMYMQEGEDDVAFKNRVYQWFVDQVS